MAVIFFLTGEVTIGKLLPAWAAILSMDKINRAVSLEIPVQSETIDNWVRQQRLNNSHNTALGDKTPKAYLPETNYMHKAPG